MEAPKRIINNMNSSNPKPVVEYCVCCNSLFDVDPLMQDIIFPICLSCYKNKWGQKEQQSNNHKEEYQSNSPQYLKSDVY
jgi:hypothetical protein